MAVFGKLAGAIPYDNLAEKHDEAAVIISRKEKQLQRYERVLTFLIMGALVICISLITYLTTIMAAAQTGDAAAFSDSMFAKRLYDVLKKTSGNVFFSPYSLQVALAMTYTGATGNTASELKTTLGFPESVEHLEKSVQASTSALKSSGDLILDVANGIFLQQDYPVKDRFSKSMASVFDAEAKTLNFSKNVEAAGHINSFVSQKTKGKVTELFSADAFNDLTRMVLVNAIYFKGLWVNKFDAKETVVGDFHLNSKDKVSVPFMSITAKFNAAESDELKATIVELPYRGDVTMVLIVPNEIEGLKHVESKLKDIDLKALTDNTATTEVELKMPKFKLEQKIELNDPLKEMGIKEMFDAGRANFGGITDKKDLYVSQVVQKAFIEVNEEGSEAAAATGIRFVMRKMPLPPLEVHVKGPFFFFVRQAQGAILFAGRVTKL